MIEKVVLFDEIRELIETLVFLKEHRKLGSEADALVAPSRERSVP